MERDFWVENVFFLGVQNDFWVKNGVWGKMAIQRDFWVKNGVLGRNGHAKGFLG